MKPLQSASQTAGPYLHIGLCPNAAGISMYQGHDLGSEPLGSDKDRVVISGRVLDGAGAAGCDVLVEAFQPEGFLRAAADRETGVWTLHTVLPTPTMGQAPHLTLWIAARGINRGLWTRLYFPDVAANATDPLLAQIPRPRVDTLIARQVGPNRFEHDVVLQGTAETVFFEFSSPARPDQGGFSAAGQGDLAGCE